MIFEISFRKIIKNQQKKKTFKIKMTKLLSLFVLIAINCYLINAQLTAIFYKTTPFQTAVINPERGYYLPTESYSKVTPYQVIDQWLISEAKRQNMTLIITCLDSITIQ